MQPHPSEIPDYSDLKTRKSRRLQSLRRNLQIGAFRAFSFGLNLLPLRGVQKSGKFFGGMLHKICKRERNTCRRQLNSCFPEFSDEKIETLSRKCFEQFGATFFEFIAIEKFRKDFDRWITVNDLEVPRKYIQEGRGCIVLFAHFCNWELYSVVYEHFKIPALATMKDYHVGRLNEEIKKRRENPYLKTVSRNSEELPKELIKFIRQKKILMTALDVDTDVKSVYVPFFGKPAMTSNMVAKLSLKYRIPVILGYGIRNEDGGHEFFYKPVYDPLKNAKVEKTEEAVTLLFNEKLEEVIRKHPEFWVWFHRRWRHTPLSRNKSAGVNFAETEKAGNPRTVFEDSRPC